MAVQADNKPLFDQLLQERNVNVNLRTNDEHSPLYYALLKYNSGDDSDDCYAAKLIENDCQTNPIYRENSNSLLHVMIRDGYRKPAVFLTKHVNNLDHVNLDGWSM